MKLPIVSIIIPVYHTNLKHLEECINSVLNQTYPKSSIEIIICEDKSEKGYREKLVKIVNKVYQINIKLIFNKSIQGLSLSRNNAIYHSCGDWVFILDSDDLIKNTAIMDLVSAITSDTIMVYSDHARVSCDIKEIKYIRRKSLYHSLIKKYANEPIFNPVYSSVFLSHGELIKKKAIIEIGGYKKDIGEKPPIWISIFEMGGIKGLIHVPSILYYYRENKNGIAAQKESELIRTHEQTFFNSMKKYCDNISEVRYLGRIEPFMAKHFAFYDKYKKIIEMPYIDYSIMRLKNLNINNAY